MLKCKTAIMSRNDPNENGMILFVNDRLFYDGKSGNWTVEAKKYDVCSRPQQRFAARNSGNVFRKASIILSRGGVRGEDKYPRGGGYVSRGLYIVEQFRYLGGRGLLSRDSYPRGRYHRGGSR